MSLEEALEVLKGPRSCPRVEARLPDDGEVRFSGTADKLETALRSMSGSFALAIVILFLLMAALFRSFKDSVLVLLALPLATVGSLVALRLMNDAFGVNQPLDLLTMIGFIILLGLVVNNAILLVHQTRAMERRGLARRAAVAEAVGMRLRPIFMTTITSICGMLPLLVVAGRRQRALPRSRRGHHRRHERQRGVHPAPAPEPAAHRRGRAPARGGPGGRAGRGVRVVGEHAGVRAGSESRRRQPLVARRGGHAGTRSGC